MFGAEVGCASASLKLAPLSSISQTAVTGGKADAGAGVEEEEVEVVVVTVLAGAAAEPVSFFTRCVRLRFLAGTAAG